MPPFAPLFWFAALGFVVLVLAIAFSPVLVLGSLGSWWYWGSTAWAIAVLGLLAWLIYQFARW